MTHNDDFPPVSRRRLIAFRIISALTGLLFLGAGLFNARAGWVVVTGATGDDHPELNRWFTTVAGTADLILAGCLLVLAWRPRLSLLFFYGVVGFCLAAVINLPFVPEFAVILALVVPALVTYPYWSQLKTVTTWWNRPHVVLLCVSVPAFLVVATVAVVALGRQIDGTGPAADANWWADYAEHVSLLGVAALIASSGRPGWRNLAGIAGGAWLYLGFVAVFSLPDHTASWGTFGGLAGMATGAVLLTAAAIGEASRPNVRQRGQRVAL